MFFSYKRPMIKLAKKLTIKLKSISPMVICDHCVSVAIGVAEADVMEITDMLGFTRDFRKFEANCSVCDVQRQVTQAIFKKSSASWLRGQEDF